MTASTVSHEVRLVRRVGDAVPSRHEWGCRIDLGPDGRHVRVGAPATRDADDLAEPAERLHDAVLARIPNVLRASTRCEVGVVRTETPAGISRRGYALATCADVVITLADDLWSPPVVPWSDTCSLADLDPALPVALGPSAVLPLVASMVEMPEAAGTPAPSWLSVHAVRRSPYPPHDCPAEIADAVRPEQWMRPMRTTRASRGQYRVWSAVPPRRGVPPVLWVESLVSLDTVGRCWHASLSVERDDGRRWLTQPLSVEIAARDLLRSVVGQLQAPQPAVDRDTVDGESFGWAPALLTTITLGELGARRRHG